MKDPSSSRKCLHFGVFEADLASRELRKNGSKVRLQDQPFQVLAFLLENRGQVVTREELRQKIWPADTFVDFDNGLNTAINKIREALGDSAEKPQFVETLPRRGYRFLEQLEQKPSGRIQFLAVLPLENLSRDPDQDYFADGLTEALITNLAKISALRVVSRTSAMHYKGVHRPLPQIARELGVDAVVEGTVQRSGDRVRISAQLVQAATDTHLWAESYERDLCDALALEAEVARAVAGEIQVKLTPQEESRLTRVRQVDPEAYESYLKGRFHWNKRTLEGFTKAAQYFQQAIDKDATYAAAYAGLADTASRLGWWGFVGPEEGCAKAKSAAKKALENDDTLADGYAALGFASLYYDYALEPAAQLCRRAMELDPRNPIAAQSLAVCLVALGRFEEGVAEILHSVQLDPLSPALHWTAGILLYNARQYDRAIIQSRKGLELDSTFPALHWNLGLALLAKGSHKEGVAELEYAAEAASRLPYFLGTLGYGYGVAGRIEEARDIVRELAPQPFTSYWIGLIHVGLDDLDSAFHFLDRACSERVPWLAYLSIVPWFDSLRSHPRFQDLRRRANFIES